MSQERIEDSTDTPWWGEHDQRYVEALKHVRKDFVILDIACGNGFGTYKLFEYTQHVVIGGDIDDEALTYCKKKYNRYVKKDVFDFKKLDATNLDFSDNTFDLIVSFETIEHIEDSAKVIGEFRRVLKPGGVLLLSTPNIAIQSPDGVVVNPYHVKEYTYDELKTLLSPFGSVAIGGQQYIRYKGKNSNLAFLTERFLYLRGVRRLSSGIKDRIMSIFGISKFYPTSDDYEIVWLHDQVMKCLTFFAVCTR